MTNGKATRKVEGMYPGQDELEGGEDPQGTNSQNGEGQGQDGSDTSTSQTDEGVGGEEGTGYEFRNPRLRGRSPEEVERLFEVLEQANKEQGSTLTAMRREIGEIKEQITKPKQPEEEPTAEDFYRDPLGVMNRALESQIQPLREEIAAGARALRPDPRAELRKKYDDWDSYEPYVDMLLQRQEFPDPDNPGLLESLYYMAKGYAQSHGVEAAPSGVASEGGEGVDRNKRAALESAIPPQHRGSSPPQPPRQGKKEAQTRQLTESERRLAREFGMSEKEYVEWQEMDERDVPVSNLGQEESK